jgi:multidrug efflux pump subunit AcrA (membrane-fusion protein)
VDIVRPEIKRKKRIRRIAYGIGTLAVAVVITMALSRLKPAAPGVDKATVWPGTVERGQMLIDVRGLGTLVPDTIHVISAPVDGTVTQRYFLPGTPVKANTVILDMTNPQLAQLQLDAEYQLKGAEATYEQTKALLENQLMDKRTTAAGITSQYQTADLQRQTQEQLFTNGLTPQLQMKTAEVQAAELKKEDELAENEVQTFENSMKAQLAVQEAAVAQKKALYDLYTSQMEQLKVRPGVDGMFQELDVDVGTRVAQGTKLGVVTQPSQLKAQLKIAETQANAILIGQKAQVDTHNGIIPGHVTRIDPHVDNGTRTVDVHLDGPLPAGAVPDLSVEGTVEIERLTNVLYVGRPVHGEQNSTISLFKVVGPWSDAKEAVSVHVELGKTSVSYVQILNGLNVGDTVILSDMSAYDAFDRIELK